MKNKRKLLFIITLLAPLTLLAQHTEIHYLSGTDAAQTVDWEFSVTGGRKSGEWTTIPVPSNWELQGFGIYNYGHDWRNPDNIIGDEKGLYRHSFEVPRDWRGKTVNIVFEGSMTDTRVTINGRSAGEVHQGAFYRFSYDISRLLRYGRTNLLEVEVAKRSSNESVNKAEREADYWIFGGIYRPVFLEVLPQTHIQRAAIYAKQHGDFEALIEFSESLRNHELVVDLFDFEGNQIGESLSFEVPRRAERMNVSGRFDGISSWNPEKPVLYDMRFSLRQNNQVVHTTQERTGFRTLEFRDHDGYYMNGEKIVFKGVNRHSFWPTTGRALSDENHIEDISLMKEMNMNAVRMSHYPPDKRFIELCDSMGLFVLNEIAGWQNGYDTIVGPKVIRSTVLRDENSPSVVMWCHGNEGGWDFDNEKWFHHYDIQKRPVVYPWLIRNGIDLHHYPSFNYGIARYHNGNDPFMPTEFLHGLFDGGHGAGLEDFWSQYQSSALHMGGFFWVFSDEAVLRTDMEGRVYDSDGDHAPDGILGHYRQKGGSFNTIREIWSPVQVAPVIINRQWNGRLSLSNKYIYTDLNECVFTWKAIKTGFGNHAEKVISSGTMFGIEARPGETRRVYVPIGNALEQSDLFLFTAHDHLGNEIYTWSWPVLQTWEIAEEILETITREEKSTVEVSDARQTVTATSGNLSVTLSKEDGSIVSILRDNESIPFTGGKIVGAELPVTSTSWEKDTEGNFVFMAYTDQNNRNIMWKLDADGILYFEADLMNHLRGSFDYLGFTFDFPEEESKSIQWKGRGPYRVWKNRLKGANIGVWEKEYNNTVTGASFNELIYPEFKGFHGNLYWMILETTGQPITVLSGTPNLFLRLFTPERPTNYNWLGGSFPEFPEGDISFMYEIPAIGTKFKNPELLGMRSEKGNARGNAGDQTYPIRLWFDFRGKE